VSSWAKRIFLDDSVLGEEIALGRSVDCGMWDDAGAEKYLTGERGGGGGGGVGGGGGWGGGVGGEELGVQSGKAREYVAPRHFVPGFPRVV